MISSTSNGFLSVLGALPIQFSMFVAFLATVTIPRVGEDEMDIESVRVYHWVWIMHLAMFATLILNHYYADKLGVARSTLNSCMMLFEVLILILISVNVAFPNQPNEEIEGYIEVISVVEETEAKMIMTNANNLQLWM